MEHAVNFRITIQDSAQAFTLPRMRCTSDASDVQSFGTLRGSSRHHQFRSMRSLTSLAEASGTSEKQSAVSGEVVLPTPGSMQRHRIRIGTPSLARLRERLRLEKRAGSDGEPLPKLKRPEHQAAAGLPPPAVIPPRASKSKKHHKLSGKTSETSSSKFHFPHMFKSVKRHLKPSEVPDDDQLV